MKQKKYNMKRYLSIFLTYILISSCSSDKKINSDFIGHWIKEDFYNHISEQKNLIDYTGDNIEFVIPDNDTNYTLINFKGNINSGPLEFMDKDHLVIKNYFGYFKNADLKLNGNKLEIINIETGEKQVFKKITSEDLNSPEATLLSTYCLPFINKKYFAGSYLLGNDTITFSTVGHISNLGSIENYSFCLSELCRNSSVRNTVFLSNNKNEGNYYEYDLKSDSLIIYEIDINAFNRGKKAGNIGVKYQLKKLN